MLKRLLPAAVLLTLTLLFFHKLAFTDLILARGDTFAYFYPYWGVRNAALIQGQLPLWTPNLFMGVPLLANSQLGTFYPLNWPLVALTPPDGIRVSILIHVFWALLGVYTLARRQLETLPALAAAAVFGLGGYVGAHVEQINQLQGISWIPWLFWLYARALDETRRSASIRLALLLGAGLALQFLSGHTQTVFITGVGLAIYGLAAAFVLTTRGRRASPLQNIFKALLTLAVSTLIALPLIVPQLIPTLELMSVSNRSGGLNPNQATAFSFNPLVMGRGLLPSYDSLVFGEYVAYGGVIGFGLALVGAFAPRQSHYTRVRAVWLAVMLVGLALAFGEFNPLYWTLAGLPGFNLFRVPARWLALFALGAAMLAGVGLQTLVDRSYLPDWRVFAAVVIVTGGLALGSTLITRTPEDVIGPAAPTPVTWIGWGAALAVLMIILRTRQASPLQKFTTPLLSAALLVELFFASGMLPFNILSTPDTYHAQRFTVSQMRAYAQEQTPPGRVLSITDLLFDPGDRATLEARYRRYGLSDLSVRLGLVGAKMQDALAANLPLAWNIPTVDGFDGGVLPTMYYTAFTSLMLPDGELRTLDGRLREILAREDCRGACIPDQLWLNLTNTRYLLTDKIYDVWHEDVAYDTQFTLTSARLPTPHFEADAVDALLTCARANCACPAIRLGEELRAGNITRVGDFSLCRLRANAGVTADTLELEIPVGVTVHALTLVDRRTGDFLQLVPDPNWRRVLSSDIKLYENQAALPRVFVVHEAVTVPDDIYGTEDALNLMRAPDFDPARMVVLAANDESAVEMQNASSESTSTITHYSAERVEIQVSATTDSYLVLTDAYYPGWAAKVNGQPAHIFRANVMFRAVHIPAGQSEITFVYHPLWLPGALIAGAAAWVFLLIALMFMQPKRSHQTLI